jgi:hypothetical protein
LIKDDFPDPDTPVIHVNKPIGISTVTFFKLFSEAFIIETNSLPGLVRFFGTVIPFLPDKYCPVIDFLLFNISSIVPDAHISPPCFPAPGPISII